MQLLDLQNMSASDKFVRDWVKGGPENFLFTLLMLTEAVAVVAGATYIGYVFLRGAVRLGRQGQPWIGILVAAAILSGLGYFLIGVWGLFVGLPILPPFWIGRCMGRKR